MSGESAKELTKEEQIKIAVIFAALIVVGIIFYNSCIRTQSPGEVARSFTRNIIEGNFEQAVNHMSWWEGLMLRSEVMIEGINPSLRLYREFGDVKLHRIDILNEKIYGDAAFAKLRISSSNGANVVDFNLVKQGRNWKITMRE